MGYIIHTLNGFRQLSDTEQTRVVNLSAVVFAIAVQTDQKPSILIIKPGNCETNFEADNDIMISCIDISKPVVASWKKDPAGAVHIYIGLAEEVGYSLI